MATNENHRPVILCKDCLYYDGRKCLFFSHDTLAQSGFIKAINYLVTPDSFCSWAMEKEHPAQFCRNCEHWDGWTGACGNPESEHGGDHTGRDSSCPAWEAEKERNSQDGENRTNL